MGISFSQQISKDITNGYMEVINDLTATTTTNLSNKIFGVNRLQASFCDLKACGRPCVTTGINIVQTNAAQQQLDATSLQTVVNQVKTSISDTTTQYIKSLNQTEQAWLAFAFNINVQDQATINNFSEKISNLISDDVTTNCSGSIINSNTAILEICGNINPTNITQSNAAIAAMSCVSKQIITNIVNNKLLFDGMQFADQQNYTDQSGPFSFLYYIGLFVLFIIIVITIAGTIRYATRTPKVIPPVTPLTPLAPSIASVVVPRVTTPVVHRAISPVVVPVARR